MENVGWKTCCGYLSGLKSVLCHQYRDDVNFTLFSGPQAGWYSGLRLELLKKYSEKHHKSKTKLTNGAPKMKEEDLKIMCTMLINGGESGMNARLASLNRCLLIFQWQMLGRISELDELCMSDIEYTHNQFTTCLTVHIDRLKTSSQHDVHLFLHSDDWVLSPFHSLAVLLLMSTPSGKLFDVQNSSMAAHVNNLFHDLSAEWEEYKNKHDCSALDAALTAALTSHSARSGCATYLNTHPRLLIQWLILRGGWSMSGVLTIFAYIAGILYFVVFIFCVHLFAVLLLGTFNSDAPVGRALSGWDPDYGGICPSISCLSLSERNAVTLLSVNLFGTVPDMSAAFQYIGTE